jgi:hypothetical protein
MRLKELGMILVGSAVVAYFVGGFVAGMIWCKDCTGLLGNTLGRIFIGLVMCVLSAIFGGFPPADMAGAAPRLNTWPFILGCWPVLFITAWIWLRPRRSP